MAARARLIPICVGVLTATVAAAETAPLSAIDWLSNSVVDAPGTEDPETPPDATMPDDILVLPLDAVVPDIAGLVDAEDLGLPPDLWGRSSADDLARAMARVEVSSKAPPALRRFFLDLLRARIDPPIDAVIDDSFFLARVDRLLGFGHLEDAARLIEAAAPPNAERFRREFDIALLQGTETDACRKVEATPDLSPTYPARIFCLARLGRWDVAALTLGNAETLGILSEAEDQLLLHFLDPELFEGEPVPPAPRQPSPLLFRLYEAVGERISTGTLPVAFAVADLGDTVGWKTRLRAVERLTAAEAMTFDDMLRVFSEREPAASGGIWERVEALQDLVDALETQDTRKVGAVLPDAWAGVRAANLEGPFALWMAPRLARMETLPGIRHLGFEIALIASDIDLAARYANGSDADRFLLSLADGSLGVPPGDPLSNAVLRGLSAFGPGTAYDALIEDGRPGEALFRALAQLGDGAEGNPEATARSLALLRALGLDALARQIAVELVLKDGAA